MYSKSTVRLCVNFKDYHGNAITPENVQLVIYDKQQNIVETINEDIVDLSQGSFFYDYTASADFIYEFSGVFNNKAILSREFVEVKFN